MQPRIRLPGYSLLPAWIPTLPKLGNVFGFSHPETTLTFFPNKAIIAKNNLFSYRSHICCFREHSAVLSQQKDKLVCPLLRVQNFKMNFLITHDEAVALVVNPPTLAPRPNFTNLRALHHHLQRALQRLVNPQNNVLGWSGLVMSRPMYQMLSTSPFRLPSDP